MHHVTCPELNNKVFGFLSGARLNVDFTLRTAPTFIKSGARKTIIITPTIIISPKRVIFVGTRISIRFQLTLIGFQTYISGIIIAGVSRDGDRSIEGGEGRGGGGYFINAKSTLLHSIVVM